MLTHWKEREGAYRVRRARIVRELGAVPAYATTVGGAPEDVEPERKRRRTRRGSVVAPEEPGQQISREEFKELVRDLDVEAEPNGGRGRGAVASAKAKTAPERDPAADLTPEDLVLKEEPKPRQKSRRSSGPGGKRRRHGRSR